MAHTKSRRLYQSAFRYSQGLRRLHTDFPRTIGPDLVPGIFESFIQLSLHHEICESANNLLKCLRRAQAAKKNECSFSSLLLEIEAQWALLPLLYRAEAISSTRFKLLSEELTDITNQTHAWLNWVRQENPKGAEKPQTAPKLH